jgi:predicted HicB family RNase H-like nuclease
MSGLQNNFQPVLAEDAPRSQSNVERRDSGPLKEMIGKMMPVIEQKSHDSNSCATAQQDSLYKYISVCFHSTVVVAGG